MTAGASMQEQQYRKDEDFPVSTLGRNKPSRKGSEKKCEYKMRSLKFCHFRIYNYVLPCLITVTHIRFVGISPFATGVVFYQYSHHEYTGAMTETGSDLIPRKPNQMYA